MLSSALESHLDQYSSKIATDMKENLYVDNLISGQPTENDVTHYYKSAQSIMSSGNFNLRAWASNSPQLQSLCLQEGTADTKTTVNVLGLQWNTLTDTLSLTPKHISSSLNLPTKREVLSNSSKIYDPQGLLSPVTIRAKLLMQELWLQNIEWDEPLSQELSEKWLSIAEDIDTVSGTMNFPRCPITINPNNTKPELHVFSDASIKAYGAVAYLRHGPQIAILVARTRVAPLKKLTLPRLELMGAVTAAQLASYVKNALATTTMYSDLTVRLWTDSQIVLHWLSSNKRLSQFITNRVQTIKDLLPKATWGYCPTNDNPADLLTRGLSATQLCSSVLWKQVPPWLTCESKWPTWSSTDFSPTLTLAISSEEINHNAPERDSIPTEHRQPGIHRIIDIEKYSKLNHLLRVTAYVLRFIALLRKDKSDTSGPLTAKELNLAERIWTHSCQSTTFPEEIENLSSKTSRRLPLIRQLRLFLDTDNSLRCGGRIHNAPLSTSAKFPYLLPKNHPFTDFVVYSAHENILNSGVNSTMTTLRQTYWIPSIRQYVRDGA